MREVARPRPLTRTPNQLRSHRIALDIPAQRQQVGITVHQDGFEPPLEQMPRKAMPLIESLGVDAIHMPHQPRQVAHAGVKHQVEVIAHQAVGQHLRVKALHGLRQDRQLT